MSNENANRLREAQQRFRVDPTWSSPAGLAPRETKQYRVKVFKSGNSLALRLPASLGLEAGMEMILKAEADGHYLLVRADAPKRKIDVSKFAGKIPGLKELPRYDFDDSPRDWAALDAPDGKR